MSKYWEYKNALTLTYEPATAVQVEEVTRTERLKPAIAYGVAFLFGCAVVAVPMLWSASAIHADETARGEQTMAPGIQMFLSVVCAPVGGTAACGILAFLHRGKAA